MTTETQVTPLAIEDYEAIESAVMETSRGRWFLTEYARRNRNADTEQVMGALDRIERTIRRERAIPDIDRIRLDLADMAQAISRTKQEIAQMKLDTEHGGRFADASHELDAIVEQTEAATNVILQRAEGIQEAAWTLREAGAADDLCNALDEHATEIYTACSFQDLTGQRTRKVVTVLRYLESRINAMMSIWGLEEIAEHIPETTDAGPGDARPDAHLLNGPQLNGRGIEQSDVDDLMWEKEEAFAPADADETSLFADVEPEPPALAADPEPAADVFATEPQAPATEIDVDLAAADVFESDATSRLAAAVRPRDEDEDKEADAFEPSAPARTTMVVGNTLRTVEIAPDAAPDAEAAPAALAVVEVEDPIAALTARQRLIVFG